MNANHPRNVNDQNYSHGRNYNFCDHTTVDEFIAEIATAKNDANTEWEKLKATLPEEEKVAAEAKVRAVLVA